MARTGQSVTADAAPGRVEQLQAYVLQLEARQRGLEAELIRRPAPEAAPAAAARAASAASQEAQLHAQVEELQARVQGMAADVQAAASVQHFEERIQQPESRLHAERQAGEQVAHLQATVRRLEAEAQNMHASRARDRAQLDAFQDSQHAAAAEAKASVRPVWPRRPRSKMVSQWPFLLSTSDWVPGRWHATRNI